MNSIFDTNEEYKAIHMLEELLIRHEIPCEKVKIFDGWGLFYPDKEEPTFDVVEHLYSYGSERDLLEAMGDGVIDVEGFLSVEEAFELFERVHHNTMKENEK